MLFASSLHPISNHWLILLSSLLISFFPPHDQSIYLKRVIVKLAYIKTFKVYK
ncbi:hypothetical protein VPHD479_0035 [Vibrio phage D479]